MTPKQREEQFSILRGHKKICEAISGWTEDNCKRLENPKLWNAQDFEVEGKANMKASVIVRNLIFNLIKREIKSTEVKKTSYE